LSIIAKEVGMDWPPILILFMPVTLLIKQVSLEKNTVPHRRVRSFHGEAGEMSWEHTREQVIEHLQNRRFHYYFQKDGRAVRLVLDRRPDGEVFVKAEKDDETLRDLLQLPPFNASPSQPLYAP
jgi:hypothetical protein